MPVKRYLVAVYGLSGVLAAFAGLVVIARVNAADSGTGEELLLTAIAAVCLGGTSLFGGVGGIAGTAVGGLALAEALRPDVALIDVELPLMDGIAVAERLRGLCPRPAVIMLTLRDDADTRERACAAGVSAFVAKRGIPDELIAAIRQAVRPPAAAPPMDRTEL